MKLVEYGRRTLAFFILLMASPRAAAALDVAGGSAANPVDITALISSGSDLNFTGGSYIVVLPVRGTKGTTTPHDLSTAMDTAYPLYDYGAGHFVDEYSTALVYRKSITGTGTLRVSNATNASTNPSTDPYTGNHPFTGGVLLFTNAQTFAAGTAASLIIDPNTTVAFDQGSASDPGGSFGSDAKVTRNIVNDGYLYLFVKSKTYSNVFFADIVNSRPGAGVVTWENGGVATDGHTYRGHSLNSAGAHIQPLAVFDFENVVNLNDFSFETYGPSYLLGANLTTSKSAYGGNCYNPGIDYQIQSNRSQGIKVLSGLVLTPAINTKKDFAPIADSLKTSYFVHSKGDFNLSIYVQATLQLGDGAAIVDYGNGLNNTAVQGNHTTVFLQTGNFESAPNSAVDAERLQTLALNYSGTYHDDACLNIRQDKASIGTPIAPGNFVVMNPDPGAAGKAPNHVILTCPMLAQGIVRVEKNAILQLGDGTVGNTGKKTVTLSNGKAFSGDYSDSSGNGIVLTKLNSAWPATHPEWSRIIDDGAIIVDNVPNALSMNLPWADAKVAPVLKKNQLDTISGAGRVSQIGSLPLTLDGVNSYTGGTFIGEAAMLLVASPTALGAASGSTGDQSGAVVNHGELACASGVCVINVPGDYDQTGMTGSP